MERLTHFTAYFLGIISCFFMLIFCQAAFATAGCCSHHGGVKGCNTSTNYQLCKDGTTSPSCLCTGGTTQTKPKTTKPASTTSTNSATTSSAPTSSETTTMTTTTNTTAATTTTTPTKKTKGCCSKHGGVAACDTATGFDKCKDGTVSTTCKCS